jgi:hypothetical protein
MANAFDQKRKQASRQISTKCKDSPSADLPSDLSWKERDVDMPASQNIAALGRVLDANHHSGVTVIFNIFRRNHDLPTRNFLCTTDGARNDHRFIDSHRHSRRPIHDLNLGRPRQQGSAFRRYIENLSELDALTILQGNVEYRKINGLGASADRASESRKPEYGKGDE